MRNLLALVGLAVVAFGGVGWYLDWFNIRSTPAPVGPRGLNIDIDTVKIKEDLHRGSVKVQQALEKNKDAAEAKAKAAAAQAQDTVKTPQFEIKAPGIQIKPPQLEIKTPLLDIGEESEDTPIDFRK